MQRDLSLTSAAAAHLLFASEVIDLRRPLSSLKRASAVFLNVNYQDLKRQEGARDPSSSSSRVVDSLRHQELRAPLPIYFFCGEHQMMKNVIAEEPTESFLNEDIGQRVERFTTVKTDGFALWPWSSYPLRSEIRWRLRRDLVCVADCGARWRNHLRLTLHVIVLDAATVAH